MFEKPGQSRNGRAAPFPGTRLDLLITGFGPFPGVPRNPSAALARRLVASGGLRRSGMRAGALILPTRYEAIDRMLRPALLRFAPRAVLLLGVAARRKAVCVERQALNRASRLMPDAGGRMASRLALEAGAPNGRRARASLPALLVAMREAGLAGRLSSHAGFYLCNAVYFATLGDGDLARRRVPVVFVHIPMPKVGSRRKGRDARPTLDAMEKGLVALAQRLLRTARRNGPSR